MGIVTDSAQSDTRWEPRRPGELTPVYLGGQGRRVRRQPADPVEDASADVASGLEIHDHGIDTTALERSELRLAGAAKSSKCPSCTSSKNSSATPEESDRWAASADGQATMRALLEGR